MNASYETRVGQGACWVAGLLFLAGIAYGLQGLMVAAVLVAASSLLIFAPSLISPKAAKVLRVVGWVCMVVLMVFLAAIIAMVAIIVLVQWFASRLGSKPKKSRSLDA